MEHGLGHGLPLTPTIDLHLLSHLHRELKVMCHVIRLIGARCKVIFPIDPEGKVFVHGEYWNAESDEAFEAGDTVEVVEVSELTLKVKRPTK